jgi:hypothetical protein
LLIALARLALAAVLTVWPLRTFTAIRTFGALFAAPAIVPTFAAFGARLAFAALAIATIAITTPTPAAAEVALAAFAVELLLLLLFARGEIDVRLLSACVGRALHFAVEFAATFLAFELTVIEALRRWRRHGRLHRTHNAEIVIGMLRVVFAQYAIAGG